MNYIKIYSRQIKNNENNMKNKIYNKSNRLIVETEAK